jgi:hypothetical protein
MTAKYVRTNYEYQKICIRFPRSVKCLLVLSALTKTEFGRWTYLNTPIRILMKIRPDGVDVLRALYLQFFFVSC